jgi:integrase
VLNKTANRAQFRAHDLRGTFVTLALANGKSETWVADRTGHTTYFTALEATGAILADDSEDVAALCARAANERAAGGTASAVIDSDLRQAVAALQVAP